MVDINAQNWREFAGKRVYRLIDSWGGRKTLQKYDGWAGGPLWSNLYGGPIDCPELAEDLLAYAQGRITKEEQEKRARARHRRRAKAKKEASLALPQHHYRSET